VLVGDSEGFTVHPSLLIHINSLHRLLGIDVGLLRLRKVLSLKVEFGLVQEHLIHALRVILPGH